MLFQVILDLRVKPESAGEFWQWLETNLPETGTYDGCVSVQALQHDSDPRRVVITGLWQSRAKWETYIKWREDRGDFQFLAPMMEEEPRFECYKQRGNWGVPGEVPATQY